MSDTKPRRWEILEGATKTIVVGAYDYDSLEAKFSRLQVRYDCLSKVYVLTRESEAALEARIAELEIVLTTIVNRYDEAKAENPNASHLMCGSTAGVANLAREVLAKKEGT